MFLLASFFDKTDSMDLEAEEVDVKFVRDNQDDDMGQISIRLPARDLAIIRQAAKLMGIGYTSYIRMIVRNHINKTAQL